MVTVLVRVVCTNNIINISSYRPIPWRHGWNAASFFHSMSSFNFFKPFYISCLIVWFCLILSGLVCIWFGRFYFFVFCRPCWYSIGTLSCSHFCPRGRFSVSSATNERRSSRMLVEVLSWFLPPWANLFYGCYRCYFLYLLRLTLAHCMGLVKTLFVSKAYSCIISKDRDNQPRPARFLLWSLFWDYSNRILVQEVPRSNRLSRKDVFC